MQALTSVLRIVGLAALRSKSAHSAIAVINRVIDIYNDLPGERRALLANKFSFNSSVDNGLPGFAEV